MFEQSLGLRENPFVAGHQPRFVYPSREHQEALAHLRFGIENREPFVLITGEVGTGKTTAIYDALSGWGTRAVVALITNSALTRAELIEEIALRFGLALTPGMTKPQALVLLERHLRAVLARQELAILLLDEAQNLERELLEEIRLLSNLEQDGQKLLQIFLVGQPELEAKLSQPELRQLRQRIAVHYRLQPMSAEETMHYLHHRIAVAGGNAHQLFPPETCREVHRLTHGIPREINTVASQALLNAYVDDSHTVKPQHVTAVAREGEFKSVIDVHGPRPAVAAAAAPSLSPPPDHEATLPVVLPAAAPPMPVAHAQPVPPPAPAPVLPAVMPAAPVPRPAAAATPPPPPPAPPPAYEPEPEVISESFETVEPIAPPAYAAPPAFEERPPVLPATEPEYEEVRVPTPEEMEAMLAEATAPLASPEPEALPEEPVVASDPWAEAAVEAEAELEVAPEPEPEPEILPAAEMPAGGGIPMPDWLEQAIAKHAPAGAPAPPPPAVAPAPAYEPEPLHAYEPEPEPEAIAPAASRAEPPVEAVPSFLARERDGAQEAIARAKSSFAEALAREQRQAAPYEPEPAGEMEREEPDADELETVGAAEHRTARILPMPGSATGAEPDFLPARLRAKLEREAEAPRRRANVAWALATIFAVAAVVTIVLAFRFGVIGGSGATDSTPAVPAVTEKPGPGSGQSAAKPAPTSAEPTAPSPQTPATTAPGGSGGTAATAPSSTPAGAPATGGASTATSAPASEAATAAPTVRHIYGIAVGTYFDRDRALAEAERVASSLNLAARYMPVAEDGTTMFRAVVGRFSDRAEAERMAGALTGRGLANEGRVVLIGTIEE